MFILKDLYKILDVRGIDLTGYEETPLSENEKHKYLKRAHHTINRNNKKITVKRVVIAALILLLISIGQQTDKIVLADIPIVGNLLEEYLQRQDNSLADYKQVLNTSVTDQGITATLNEVLIEGDQIFISTTFTSDSVNWDNLTIPKLKVSVNGTPLSGIVIIRGQKKVISSDCVNFLSAVKFKELTSSNNLHIELKYSEIINRLSRQQSIKGNWCFDFQASTETLLNQTRVISINREIKLDNGQEEFKGVIDNLVISPVSTTLNYRCLSCNDDVSQIKFTITDHNGVKLEKNSDLGSSSETQKRFQPINEDVTALVITPCITRSQENDGLIYDSIIPGEPIKIKIK